MVFGALACVLNFMYTRQRVMEFEDATTGSRNPSPSLPESAEFFADEAVTGYQGAGKSSLEQCAKMEAESTQRGIKGYR